MRWKLKQNSAQFFQMVTREIMMVGALTSLGLMEYAPNTLHIDFNLWRGGGVQSHLVNLFF